MEINQITNCRATFDIEAKYGELLRIFYILPSPSLYI